MWALDLGTTNTLLARWDSSADRPALVELPAIARRAARTEAGDASRAVPSAVHVLEQPSFWARTLSLGPLALVGRQALEQNALRHRPAFVPTFKRALGRSPLVTVARAGGRGYSARDAAWLFLRELFAQARAATGARVRDLVVTAPIDAYETYRAEVAAACKRLGVRRVRTIDEPVAAALGYGIGLGRERRLLVVDFGGGTLHVAVVRAGLGDAERGQGAVLAKASRDVGGNLVDQWIFEEVCARLRHDPAEQPGDEAQLWTALMLAEACRVKEAVYFDERATFALAPPESLRRLDERVRGEAASLEVSRGDLMRLLDERGLYRALMGCLDEALAEAATRGESDVDEVLMVGGSTLLPGVYKLFEDRFGRGRVRAWQPFEAVVHGAAVFAAGRALPSDFIVHDYALVTHDKKTGKADYSIVVPRGTSFPTADNFWSRELVPTCALGEPERVFKLVICELGASASDRFAWDADGRLRRPGEVAGEPLVVKLNEANPALGRLDPPHSPRDLRPRLRIGFGVNAERWLCATVTDLLTGRTLMRGEPVVRLL